MVKYTINYNNLYFYIGLWLQFKLTWEIQGILLFI